VTIAGATIDTDLNGTYTIATTATATTFTFTTANVSDATYTEATLNVSTPYARDSQLVWSIWKNYYTTTYLDRSTWARGTNGPATAYQFACSAMATYF
jgi:hypothetical protein